jgi:hypothetical protein
LAEDDFSQSSVRRHLRKQASPPILTAFQRRTWIIAATEWRLASAVSCKGCQGPVAKKTAKKPESPRAGTWRFGGNGVVFAKAQSRQT